jgi:phosphoglycerate dehydrogenase-like enzyme
MAQSLRIPCSYGTMCCCFSQVFQDNGHKLVEKKLGKKELLEVIGSYDGLVVRSGVQVTEDIIRAGTKLRIVSKVKGARWDDLRWPCALRPVT